MERTARRKRYLLPKRKRKIQDARGERNKKQGAGRYTATCTIHGIRGPKDHAHWIKVAPPRNKKERFTKGCPKCLKA